MNKIFVNQEGEPETTCSGACGPSLFAFLIPNFSELNELPHFKESKAYNTSPNFVSEEINIKELDYYYTNVISRASKTMSECRQIKYGSKKTGTDNL